MSETILIWQNSMLLHAAHGEEQYVLVPMTCHAFVSKREEENYFPSHVFTMYF